MSEDKILDGGLCWGSGAVELGSKQRLSDAPTVPDKSSPFEDGSSLLAEGDPCPQVLEVSPS